MALVLILFSFSSIAQIEGVYTVIIKKQEEKRKSRWTLADWLMTKKTIALQDQWLALHSSENWFEFVFDYAGGAMEESTEGITSKVDLSRWGAAFYIKFLGLEYNSYDFSRLYDSSDYRINLLILGSSVQSTHLRAFYGRRDYSYENFSSYKKQNFWGGHLTFYLMNFLGLEAEFSKFKNITSEDTLYSSDGERREFGAFVDLWMLRLYVSKFHERMLFRGATFKNSTVEGTLFGAKLFF